MSSPDNQPQQRGCGVSNPGGIPCTKEKGHPAGHDLEAYGPQPTEREVERQQGEVTPEMLHVQIVGTGVMRFLVSDRDPREVHGDPEDHGWKQCPFCGGQLEVK